LSLRALALSERFSQAVAVAVAVPLTLTLTVATSHNRQKFFIINWGRKTEATRQILYKGL